MLLLFTFVGSINEHKTKIKIGTALRVEKSKHKSVGG